MEVKSNVKQGFKNISYLFFIRWANIRNEWYFHFFIAPLIPIFILIFLYISGNMDSSKAALHLLTGNIILSIAFGPFQSLSNDFAISKVRNDFDFLAMLPIKKSEIIFSYSLVSFISTIPSIFIILGLGKVWLKLNIHINIYVVLTIILSAFSLIGLGAAIGVSSKSLHQSNLFTSIFILLFTFVSPTIVSYQKLPLILKIFARIMPTTYAVEAFRVAISGEVFTQYYLNILILLIFICVFMFIVTKKMDWREE